MMFYDHMYNTHGVVILASFDSSFINIYYDADITVF